MENIFIYNLIKLDTSSNKNKTVNLNNDQKNIKKINKNYILKKHLGTSHGGDIFQIKHENPSIEKSYRKITKIICKKVDLSSKKSIKSMKQIKDYIKNYVKNIQDIKRHPVGRQYVNGIINYKIINNYLYVFYPYYKGNNINNLQNHLSKLDDDNYKTLIKYLVKKILTGFKTLHNLNVILNPSYLAFEESIIINTTKLNNEKRPDLKVKFFNIVPHSFLSITKTSSKNNHVKCGNMLIDILSKKYKLDYKTSLKRKSSQMVQSFKNIFKTRSTKKTVKNKLPPLKEIVPDDIYEYITIIRTMMIDTSSFSSYDMVLKEILLNEKYKDNE